MVASRGMSKGLRGKSKTHGKAGGAKEHIPHSGGHGTKGPKGPKKMGGRKHAGRMGRRG